MIIYAAGRRAGKTSKMIEWFLADPSRRIIITPNVQQANYILKRIQPAMQLGFPYEQHIIPFMRANEVLNGAKHYEIGVENLDMVINSLFHNPIQFATVTGVTLEGPAGKPWWKFWK